MDSFLDVFDCQGYLTHTHTRARAHTPHTPSHLCVRYDCCLRAWFSARVTVYQFRFPTLVAAGIKYIDSENAITPAHFERDRLTPAQLERDCSYPYSLSQRNLQHGETLKEVILISYTCPCAPGVDGSPPEWPSLRSNTLWRSPP